MISHSTYARQSLALLVARRKKWNDLTFGHAIRQDSIPRIVEDIPRRIPKELVRLEQDFVVGLKDFFLPTDWGDQGLPWRILFAAAVLLAITAELISVSTRTARSLAEARREQQERSKRLRKEGEGEDLGPELPEIPRTRLSKEKLQEDRSAYRREIRAERSRGLGWLAAITAIAIWCTGILFKDNALQP